MELFSDKAFQSSWMELNSKWFWGFIIITTELFVLLAAKPLYYLIMLGSIYDGGFANFEKLSIGIGGLILQIQEILIYQ